jgi:hypothetical protein
MITLQPASYADKLPSASLQRFAVFSCDESGRYRSGCVSFDAVIEHWSLPVYG